MISAFLWLFYEFCSQELPVQKAEFIIVGPNQIRTTLSEPQTLKIHAYNHLGQTLGSHREMLPAGTATRPTSWRTSAPYLLIISSDSYSQSISRSLGSSSSGVRLSRPHGMRRVPEGADRIGSPATEANRFFDELLHWVHLSAFWIDTTPVTRCVFQALMGTLPLGTTCNQPLCPADSLSWFDAMLFCNQRSKQERLDTAYSYREITRDSNGQISWISEVKIYPSTNGYRLPSEAQWEVAARSGDTLTWPWGGDSPANFAWFFDNSKSYIHPIATRFPNRWGLYEMAGNVWEWAQDWYAPYDTMVSINPIQENLGLYRVLRGGSFADSLPQLRCAFRNAADPSLHLQGVGFRCVRPASSN